MSKSLKGFVCVVLIVCGACAPLGRHVGLDVSKTGEIILATGDGKSGNTLAHESFPNCVVVDCDDGSLHVPLDNTVCRSTSAADPKTCGVLRGAIMMAGLNEEDDPLETEMIQSHKAKLALDSNGELFYSVDAFPSKKIHLDEVLDVIFRALPDTRVGSTATMVIPHDFLFEQRQAIMDSLMRARKIEVIQSLRFNPCLVSENQECSVTPPVRHNKASLDSVVIEQLEKHAIHPSHSPVAAIDEKKNEIYGAGTHPTTDPPLSAPSRYEPGSTREEIELLDDIVLSNNVASFGGALYLSQAPSSIPGTSVPSSGPVKIPTTSPTKGPTTSTPTHLRVTTRTPTTRRTTSRRTTVLPTKSVSTSRSTSRVHDTRMGDMHGYNGEAGVLTASEWEDTKNYSFWKTLVNCTGRPPQCFAHVERKWNLCTGYPIRVSVSQLNDENTVADLSIAIFSESHMKMKGFGRTDVNGNTTVFLKIDDPHCSYRDDLLTDLQVSFQVERTFMGEFDVKNMKREDAIPQVHFVIDRKIKQENTLDLMFVTDTTGSMSDELSFLKSDLEKIIENVQQACADDTQVKIRTSVNFYRDAGDEYVVKGFPFDTDVKRNVKRVSAQFASGGGDFPEAVDRALDDALFNHKWSKKHGAKARLLFLILDAPPHSTREGINSLVKTMKRAQKVGVRIIPVTGSGIDKETEMLMRAFGLVTDGSYIHLTDDSGVGLPHVETQTTIPDHPVGKLLDVMVGTIRRYLGCTANEDELGANLQVH